ncbi:MAG: RdgB/HAM1 family non-canonical purine NTP pyrophosphatase [Verrucomicrobiota bacterium]
MQSLVIATHNSHKTDEIRAILGDRFSEITDLASLPDFVPPEETGTTFEANAKIKALAASEKLPEGTLVLADDSGLEVDGLDGAPGVFSARYAGEGADDAANRAKLLAALAGKSGDARQARFRCVMALARKNEITTTFDGTVEGTVIEEERGEGGFGYDALFVPEGYEDTFAELSAATKNQLSHRARALVEVVRFLENG